MISLVVGFIPSIGEYASLARTFTFLPFYVIGFYAKDLNLIEWIWSDKFKKGLVIAFILILILSLVYGDLLPYRLLRGKYSYYSVTGSLLSVFIKQIIFYGFSIIVSLTFLKIIPKDKTLFTKMGANTLYIYLIQGMVIKTLISNNLILGNILVFVIVALFGFLFTKFIFYFKDFIKGRINFIWIKNLNVLRSH